MDGRAVTRCRLGPRKLRQLSRRIGLEVVSALTRGGTDHRVDLRTADGQRLCWWPDGTLQPAELARKHALEAMPPPPLLVIDATRPELIPAIDSLPAETPDDAAVRRAWAEAAARREGGA
jgi:hypothetical protein